MDTLELNIHVSPRDPWAEIIVAELADNGFDAFVDTVTGIQAYGPGDIDWKAAIQNLTVFNHPEVKLEVIEKLIPHQNWNASWEENFDPVFVDDFLAILAPFHQVEVGKRQVIRIQPQMSFGTGHHQTSRLMTRLMHDLAMPEKVLDMGTGTGILAIYAEMLGAKSVLGVEIEPWSAENARENAEQNSCKNVQVICGDVDAVPNEHYGLIVANINKNILKNHMATYQRLIEQDGILLLSGFFIADADEMIEIAAKNGFDFLSKETEDEWLALKLIKK